MEIRELLTAGANAEAVAAMAASRMAQRYMVMVVFYDCSFMMLCVLLDVNAFGNEPIIYSSSDFVRKASCLPSAAGADRYLGPFCPLSSLCLSSLSKSFLT